MLAIFRKEILSFFSSLQGYLILGLFLLVSGLFLWVFKGPFNVFDNGFANLSPFFLFAPWVFLFLIPALTMKSFAEEKSLGTLELLQIKPISTSKLVLGKFLAVFTLCLITLLPTVVYVFAVSDLGMVKGNYDFGLVLGSYFGLLFLIACYAAIGVFSSCLTKSQVVAFIIGIALCFLVFYGFEAISTLFENGKQQRWVQSLGAKFHYQNIARGVISTKGLIYFSGLALFFLFLSKMKIEQTKVSKKEWSLISVIFIILVVASKQLDYRIDLTEDKRYTLSESAKTTVENLESPIIVDVLLDGNLPSEFARLQEETILLLDAFNSVNKNIEYNLVDPLDGSQNQQQTLADLQQIGLTPANVTTQEDGKVSQEFVFPWAMVNAGNQTFKVPLLKNKLGSSAEDRINNSVQQLEYAFADAFTKLGMQNKKRIAVIKGNGELNDAHMADYLTTIRDYYNIAAFTLDSVATNAQKTLNELVEYDLAIIAKPTGFFSDEEKFVLDQFIVNGGKSLWLIDQVAMELDSLFNEKGSSIATPLNLNLNDFFFRYGVRINPVLVNDLYNTPIVLASGENSGSEYNPLPWVYNPMVFSRNDHPINNNIEAVRLQFANVIDTLPNDNSKTVLLRSSPLSLAEGIPKEVNLNSITKQKPRETYAEKGDLPLAVLIEGKFKSAFANRLAPVKLSKTLQTGQSNKMVVVADGDVIKNQLRNGQPLELGYDKWTNSFYGNKEFLVNVTNYLLDDTGLLQIRSKEVAIPVLDPQKIVDNKQKWQLLTIFTPLCALALFGVFYNYKRKRKYAI